MSSTRQCIKVESLRKKFDKNMNLKKWLEIENNVYVGRHGRIFIKEDGKSNIFHYPGSKWMNIYKVEEYGLSKAIELYEKYITEKIKNNPEEYDLKELINKNLGCWCDMKNQCHVDVLLKLINENEKL